jgi:hypothetical protein
VKVPIEVAKVPIEVAKVPTEVAKVPTEVVKTLIGAAKVPIDLAIHIERAIHIEVVKVHIEAVKVLIEVVKIPIELAILVERAIHTEVAKIPIELAIRVEVARDHTEVARDRTEKEIQIETTDHAEVVKTRIKVMVDLIKMTIAPYGMTRDPLATGRGRIIQMRGLSETATDLTTVGKSAPIPIAAMSLPLQTKMNHPLRKKMNHPLQTTMSVHFRMTKVPTEVVKANGLIEKMIRKHLLEIMIILCNKMRKKRKTLITVVLLDHNMTTRKNLSQKSSQQCPLEPVALNRLRTR